MATWRATGGSDAGFAAFDAWSQKSEKYDDSYTSKKWTGYLKSPPTSIGAGTILYLAEQHSPGWRPISYPEMRPRPDPFPHGLPVWGHRRTRRQPQPEPRQQARELDQELPTPEPEPPPADEPKGDDQDELVRRLNDKYIVVPDGGKTHVLTFDRVVRTANGRTYARQLPTFYSFSDFRNLLMHRKVWSGDKPVALGLGGSATPTAANTPALCLIRAAQLSLTVVSTCGAGGVLSRNKATGR